MHEMVFMKRLFEGRKAQIISDVLKFKNTAHVCFDNVTPVFQNILKK
jgi:hypothetical protein